MPTHTLINLAVYTRTQSQLTWCIHLTLHENNNIDYLMIHSIACLYVVSTISISRERERGWGSS